MSTMSACKSITSPTGMRIVRRSTAIALAALIAGCATSTPPRESGWHPQPASPQELQAIAAITETGRAIHRQDQFVWHDTRADRRAARHGEGRSPCARMGTTARCHRPG